MIPVSYLLRRFAQCKPCQNSKKTFELCSDFLKAYGYTNTIGQSNLFIHVFKKIRKQVIKIF